MTRRLDRRQALGAFGTVSLGALLAGCGDDRVTSPDTASRFGDESSCTLTPEMTEGPYYFDVHIHAKVHLDSSTVLTTQLFFDDAVSDRVFAAAPYNSRGERDVRNDGDGIFDEALVVDLSRAGDGYLGTISFDVAAS